MSAKPLTLLIACMALAACLSDQRRRNLFGRSELSGWVDPSTPQTRPDA
jgi:hypothetical protein